MARLFDYDFAAAFDAGCSKVIAPFFISASIVSDVAGNHFAVEQLHGQRVLDEPLDGALQRPRPELRIVAFAEEQFVSFLRQRDLNLALGEQPAQVLEAASR